MGASAFWLESRPARTARVSGARSGTGSVWEASSSAMVAQRPQEVAEVGSDLIGGQ